MSHLTWVIKENMKIRLFVKFRDRIKELPELMKHTGTGTIGEPFQSQARMAKGGSFTKMWTSGAASVDATVAEGRLVGAVASAELGLCRLVAQRKRAWKTSYDFLLFPCWPLASPWQVRSKDRGQGNTGSSTRPSWAWSGVKRGRGGPWAGRIGGNSAKEVLCRD